MGLFDSFKTKVQPAFNPQKAIMTVVVAAIRVDGNVSDEEIARLRSMCARSPVFASNTKGEDDAVIDFALNVTDQLGMGAIEKAAEALKPELRETAFAFAVEMVLADGMVGQEEEAFIAKLAQLLGIHEELGRAVIQVTMIRARGV
ncbi:MAG: tellurite resistance TerB family protein [Kiritimatiellae bacterium]|jgi:uncharacterized tellurite resistance protein B-like protein|nr:tellurite resistance TerB family protein [Kiritimatiellia bacterium]HOU21023.1 tellurite resistance TerB family protein [Kiritimatiellia bacterium]HQQ61268.1 tellurite resistance TerB family protein [Kiritimatiellia bacterium]